jgi:hypothetical protein
MNKEDILQDAGIESFSWDDISDLYFQSLTEEQRKEYENAPEGPDGVQFDEKQFNWDLESWANNRFELLGEDRVQIGKGKSYTREVWVLKEDLRDAEKAIEEWELQEYGPDYFKTEY